VHICFSLTKLTPIQVLSRRIRHLAGEGGGELNNIHPLVMPLAVLSINSTGFLRADIASWRCSIIRRRMKEIKWLPRHSCRSPKHTMFCPMVRNPFCVFQGLLNYLSQTVAKASKIFLLGHDTGWFWSPNMVGGQSLEVN